MTKLVAGECTGNPFLQSPRHLSGLKMPYLIVRESYLNNSCLVDGLPLNEVRTVTEKSSCPSDLRDEKNR